MLIALGGIRIINVALGKVSTEEEKMWLKKTGGWGNAPPEVAEKIREDVLASRWTPFGQDYEYGKGFS